MLFTGLPNRGIDVAAKLGISCSSQTVRHNIKAAALIQESLVMTVKEFRDEHAGGTATPQQLQELLAKLSSQPYLFMGMNKMPTKMVYNSE